MPAAPPRPAAPPPGPAPRASGSAARRAPSAAPAACEYGSAGSWPTATASTRSASATLVVSSDTQSRLRQAGTTPRVPIAPSDALTPTIAFIAAGTRPEPAVSVASANGTVPSATTTAEPELDPPAT